MQVHGFRVRREDQFVVVVDTYNKVQKHDFFSETRVGPSQFSVVVEVSDELVPCIRIGWVIFPDSDDVINESTVMQNVFSVFWYYCVCLVYSNLCVDIVDCCGCSHCCSASLSPIGVSELKYIIFHYFQQEFCDKSGRKIVVDCLLILLQPVSYFIDCVVGVTIVIHYLCIE